MVEGPTNQPSIAKYRVSPYVNKVREYAYLILRIGLGLVIFLAGAHKLVAPGIWTEYAAPWVVPLWPESLLSLELAMIINSVFEIFFGLAILAGFYTTIIAGITALALVSVVTDLLTGAIMTGKFDDILIRDIGLSALATGVMLLSTQRDEDEETRLGHPCCPASVESSTEGTVQMCASSRS